MNIYRIADLTVFMKTRCKRLSLQSRPYCLSDDWPPEFCAQCEQLEQNLVSGKEPNRQLFQSLKPPVDMLVFSSKESVDELYREHPECPEDDCEYILTGTSFYHQLLSFDGFMLHASAVAYENKAYLFSASSGTGKSTHTRLWQKVFGKDNALIINDDKPALRLIDGRFYVYGTPWSGKSDKNLNICIPLQGIAFLEQALENSIEPIPSNIALFSLLNQTCRPRNPEKMTKLCSLLNHLLNTVPIFKLKCSISEEAVRLSYQTMKKTNVS